MKKAICYLLLIGFVSCKWADPALKTLKNCVFPTDFTITPDAADSRKYTFAVVGSALSDIKTITWKVLSGATVLGTFTLNANQSLSYSVSVGGNYTITAEVETICGERKTLSKSMSVRICTPPTDILVTPDPTDVRKLTFRLAYTVSNDITSVTWKTVSVYKDQSYGALAATDIISYNVKSSEVIAVTAVVQTACGQVLTFTKNVTAEFKVFDKSLGGSANDEAAVVLSTTDGGYLMAGRSISNISNDKTDNNRGNEDYWIAKINSNGVRQWDKTFGGAGNDLVTGAVQTSDGGYLIVGRSNSNASVDKSENSRGEEDYWVVKLNANGIKQWDKTYGSSASEIMSSVIATPDGGFLLGGSSNSGAIWEKSENSYGDWDYWVIKIDANGKKQWDKIFGGFGRDIMERFIVTPDGGFLLGGYSNSNASMDKSESSRGDSDYWIVKVNSSGNKQWDRTFGGAGADLMNHILITQDGGFLLGGFSSSGISGDKSDINYGGRDYWIVKINSNGNKQWDKSFGGSGNEVGVALLPTLDGGFLLGGSSNSNTNDIKSENSRGGYDYWIVKIENNGSKAWDKTFGGEGDDQMYTMSGSIDGRFLLIGYSDSNISGDKSENSRGGRDFWIVKVR